MLTRASRAKDFIERRGTVRIPAGLMAFDTSPCGAIAMGFWRIRVDAIQDSQDMVVLATVATDGNDDEAPENTRDQ